MLSKNCQNCGKEFEKPYRCSNRDWNLIVRFCSRSCHDKFRKGKPSPSPATTFKRGNKIFSIDNRKKRIGSENYLWKGGQAQLVCKICNSPFLVYPHLKNIAKTCSKDCYNKYRKLPEVRIRLSEKQKEVFKSNLRTISKTLDKLIRHSVHYRLWREAVFKRDIYTCQICSQHGVYLQADHIKPFALILIQNNIKTFDEALACKELWIVKNGRTLCVPCHKKTDTYGQKVNILKS